MCVCVCARVCYQGGGASTHADGRFTMARTFVNYAQAVDGGGTHGMDRSYWEVFGSVFMNCRALLRRSACVLAVWRAYTVVPCLSPAARVFGDAGMRMVRLTRSLTLREPSWTTLCGPTTTPPTRVALLLCHAEHT